MQPSSSAVVSPLARVFGCVAFLMMVLAGPMSGALAQFGGVPAVKVSAVWNTKTVTPGAQQVVAVTYEVPRGYHAQSATPSSADYIAFTLKVDEINGAKAHPAVYAKGKDEKYELLGTLNVYEGKVVTYVPVTIAADAATGSTITIKGTINSQICDDNTCFPPNDDTFTATVTVAATGTATEPTDPELFKGFDWSKFGESSAPATRPAAMGGGGGDGTAEARTWSVGGALAGAFVVGLIFNVMPCVLPVLPLKAVGFIEASHSSRAKSVWLGVAFSTGMIAIFAGLGVAVFSWKLPWGFLFQQNWFVFGMALILVFMALSQWGLWTVSLPQGMYMFEPRHDTASGNFLFGGFTALLSTPCTAYVFPALLAWGTTQPRPIAIGMMMTVGVGMALPYFLMACFPALARRVPRTGPWSEIVKQMMGFLILATAVYFVGTKLFDGFKWLWPVAGVAIVASLFLIYRTAKLMPRPRPIVVAALVALLLSGTSVYGAAAFNQKSVEWMPYSDEKLAEARKAGNIVLIDFTANWCANCHYIEATVFTDKEVKKTLAAKDVVLLRVDITNSGAPGSDLLKSLNPAGGIPLTAIYFPGQAEPTQIAAVYTKGTLLEKLK